MKVMIVDDSRVQRVVMAKKIKQIGCDICEAENGLEALNMIIRERPNLIILDVNMPIMAGDETLEHIKNHPKVQNVRVVMHTANEDGDTIMRCLELGADDYIVKANDSAELYRKLERFIVENSKGYDAYPNWPRSLDGQHPAPDQLGADPECQERASA